MKIDTDVLKAIRSATVDGLTLRLNGTLDRKFYDRVHLLECGAASWLEIDPNTDA